jgi:rhodanese-related sulfurtransferase
MGRSSGRRDVLPGIKAWRAQSNRVSADISLTSIGIPTMPAVKPMVTEIDRDELKQKKLDHPKKSVLVEALPLEYFRKLHLPGAIKHSSRPYAKSGARANSQQGRGDNRILRWPYCRASRQAADELTGMGYVNVCPYVGGKQDWTQAGLPVVRNEPKAAA